MTKFDRTIKLARDVKNNTLIDSDIEFGVTKDAFAKRRQFAESGTIFECLECGQTLYIATSKFDRLHFKHGRSEKPCILKDGDLDSFEIEQFNNVFRSKESARHKYLKHKISELLNNTDGVTSVITDSRFLNDELEKRRPDVYCEYQGKKLAFEIQLSDLSYKYIIGRHLFYKRNKIYLIWILDDFDVSGQSHTERDIKYLNDYQNFFKLNESASTLKLDCTYKIPFISQSNELHTKWTKETIHLEGLSFCSNSFQAYYFDYPSAEIEKKSKIDDEAKKIAAIEKKKIDDSAIERAISIINQIRIFRERGYNFYKFSERLSTLTEPEIIALNRRLDFKNKTYKGEPILNYYLKTAQQQDNSFIEFLLHEKKIELNVNTLDIDGYTTLRNYYENAKLHRYGIIENLFIRGYVLKNSDIDFLKLLEPEWHSRDEIALLQFLSDVKGEEHIRIVSKYRKLLYIIESARRQEIVGFNYNSWVSLAVHAIDDYKRFWSHIELAFNKYGLTKIINSVDKKGTFQRKMSTFYDDYVETKYDPQIDEVVNLVFPDLYE